MLLPARLAAQPPAGPSEVPADAPRTLRTLAEEALLSSSGPAEAASVPAATDDAQVAREIARLKQLARDGEADAACAGATALAQRFPHEACAYAIRGVFLQDETGDSARANEDFDQALRLRPDSDAIRMLRAAAWTRQGRLEEAVDEFKKCLGLHRAHVHLVQTLERLKRPAEARSYLEQCLARWPNSAESYALAATVEHRAGNTDAAVAAASKAIQLDSASPHTWRLRGRLLAEGQQDVAAAADYAAALERTTDPSERGRTYAELAGFDLDRPGGLGSAVQNLTLAARADPTNPHYLLFRAFTFFRLGDLEEARTDYDTVIAGMEAGTMRGGSPKDLANVYVGRAKVRLLLRDYEGHKADRAEAERLENEEASKEASKP